MMSTKYPLFVKRDLDGFFGLFIDNLVQLLLIVALCGGLCGMSGEASYLIFGRILPGAAVSLLIGNLFYAWQAHRLAAKEGREDVCALPYGINTPSLLVYVFFVIAPVYRQTGSAELAWQMGLVACMGSGLIEFLGAFVAERVRRHTPRAALLSTLAGIALGFISMAFALQIWQNPIVAMLPFGIVLATYFSGVRFPLGLPGGLVAILLGSLAAWMLPSEWVGHSMSAADVSHAWSQRGWHWPVWCGGEIINVLRSQPFEVLGYLSFIVPMGLFNLVGSLQNIESASAGGDRYATGPSLAMNGLGTIVAAAFGSCFPTTIYIGHPGWKGLGARAGYSSLNGIVITLLALSGTVSLMSTIIPIEAGIAIVVWIGVVITAQAYQATPSAHAPAVALGLFPAIAAWGQTVASGSFMTSGKITMQQVLEGNLGAEVNGFLLHGMNLLQSGYIFTCMVLAAMSACLIDRRFVRAGVWAFVGAGLTFLGLMHAYSIQGNVVGFYSVFGNLADGALGFRATRIALGYGLIGICFSGLGAYHRKKGDQIFLQTH